MPRALGTRVVMGLLAITVAGAGCGADESVPGDGSSGHPPGANDDAPWGPGQGGGEPGTPPGDSQDSGEQSDGEPGNRPDSGLGTLAYRLDTLAIRDPHFFIAGGDRQERANRLIATKIDEDDDDDGQLDFSLVAVANLSDLARVQIDVYVANCPVADPTSCTAVKQISTVPDAELVPAGTCVEPIAGTLNQSYRPALTLSQGPCLRAGPMAEITTEVPGVSIMTLTGAYFSVSVDAADLARVRDGVLMGFVTEAAAALPFGDDVPVANGDPMSEALRASDMDTGPAGETGWWFYMNFTGVQVTFST
jgi:hypothetical protein